MSDRIITHASVFSGIGASEIAAEMLGWKNLFHCEINEFGRKVLDYHFPNAISYEDITTTDFSEWRGKVTVLTGGFPCQPFSYAGKRRGSEDDRYLWPYMLNCINQVRPTWFIGENVAGITTMVFPSEDVKVGEQADLFGEGDGYEIYEKREKYVLGEIYGNLENIGYSVQAFIVPACAVGAPHRRDRIFIVAHRPSEDSDSVRCGGDIREEEPQSRKFGMSGAGSDEWICKKEDAKPSPNTHSTRQSKPDKQNRREWEKMDGRSESKSFDGVGRHGLYGIASDTASERGRKIRKQIQTKLSNGAKSFRNGRRRIASYAKGKRSDRFESEQRGACKSESCEFRRKNCSMRLSLEDRWRHFPTQSPVYRGNDGFPFNVDSLTISFAKWKKETLKAYGNAIVPQVMYEIFLMIDEIEKMKKNI